MKLQLLKYKYDDENMFINEQIGKLYEELVELKHAHEKKDSIQVLCETLDIIQVCISIVNTYNKKCISMCIRNHNEKLKSRGYGIIKHINIRLKNI